MLENMKELKSIRLECHEVLKKSLMEGYEGYWNLIYKGKDSVLKNLKPGWYPFGHYQCPTSKNGWQWMTEEQIKGDEYTDHTDHTDQGTLIRS